MSLTVMSFVNVGFIMRYHRIQWVRKAQYQRILHLTDECVFSLRPRRDLRNSFLESERVREIVRIELRCPMNQSRHSVLGAAEARGRSTDLVEE